MSVAAMSAIRQCYSIIGMDSSSLRHRWARQSGESLRMTYRRRREMLNAAGQYLCSQYMDWDDLRESVRDALNEALMD